MDRDRIAHTAVHLFVVVVVVHFVVFAHFVQFYEFNAFEAFIKFCVHNLILFLVTIYLLYLLLNPNDGTRFHTLCRSSGLVNFAAVHLQPNIGTHFAAAAAAAADMRFSCRVYIMPSATN